MPTPDTFAKAMKQLAFDYSVSDYDTFRAKGEQLMRDTLAELGHKTDGTARAMCDALMSLNYENGIIFFIRAPNIDMESEFNSSRTKAQ